MFFLSLVWQECLRLKESLAACETKIKSLEAKYAAMKEKAERKEEELVQVDTISTLQGSYSYIVLYRWSWSTRKSWKAANCLNKDSINPKRVALKKWRN